MKHHPYAELFPMLEDGPLQELADDIKEKGQLEKGITHKGALLDGRNREAACKLAKVKFETKEYRGNDPLGFVISKNLRGRHLTVAQRAEIAVKIANMTHGGDRSSKASNEALKPVTQTEAAEKVGVSRSTVQRAAAKKKPPKEPEVPGWTAEEVRKDTTLFDDFTAISAVYGNDDTKAIRTGSVGLKRAEVAQLAKLPKERMLEIRDLIFENHWTPTQCLKFLGQMADHNSTVEDLMNFCLATKGHYFEATINQYTVTCKLNRAAKR